MVITKSELEMCAFINQFFLFISFYIQEYQRSPTAPSTAAAPVGLTG